jgi:hypothetical protein
VGKTDEDVLDEEESEPLSPGEELVLLDFLLGVYFSEETIL